MEKESKKITKFEWILRYLGWVGFLELCGGVMLFLGELQNNMPNQIIWLYLPIICFPLALMPFSLDYLERGMRK